MQSATHNFVIAMFDDPAGAHAAVRALHDAGFTHDEVGMVAHPVAGDDAKTLGISPEAVFAGATVAGLAGATIGMSPVVPGQLDGGAAGLTLAAMVGYGLLSRGFSPVFTDSGMDEEDARYVETEYRSGRSVVVVKPGERVDDAVQILKSHGGHGKRASAD